MLAGDTDDKKDANDEALSASFDMDSDDFEDAEEKQEESKKLYAMLDGSKEKTDQVATKPKADTSAAERTTKVPRRWPPKQKRTASLQRPKTNTVQTRLWLKQKLLTQRRKHQRANLQPL